MINDPFQITKESIEYISLNQELFYFLSFISSFIISFIFLKITDDRDSKSNVIFNTAISSLCGLTGPLFFILLFLILFLILFGFLLNSFINFFMQPLRGKTHANSKRKT